MSAAGSVTVSQQLSWSTVRPTVQVDRSGGTLTVTVHCGDPFGGVGCRADLTVLVPQQTPLTATARSGDLTAQGLVGPLDLRSSSGDIELDDVSGPVQAATTSGAIDGSALDSTRFSARSDSGPVSVDFAAPPAQVAVGADSGPIEVDLPRGSRYRVSGASNGPRDIEAGLTDPTAPDSITVNTDSGPVTLEYN